MTHHKSNTFVIQILNALTKGFHHLINAGSKNDMSRYFTPWLDLKASSLVKCHLSKTNISITCGKR